MDLAGADVSQVASPVEVGKAGVIAVSTAQYKDERSAVGRVIVALEGARRYEVTPRGDAVVVKVLAEGRGEVRPGRRGRDRDAGPDRDPDRPATADPDPDRDRDPDRRPAPAATPAEKVVIAEEMRLDAAPAADDHVVSRRVDEAKVSSPARAVTGVTARRGTSSSRTDGDVGRIEVIELRDPARLVLDLHGVARAPAKPVKGDGGFTQVRFGKGDGKVRVVLDTAGALPGYEVKRVKHGVAIVAGEGRRSATAAVDGRRLASAARRPPAPAAGRRSAAAPRAKIADVRFAQQGGFARIDISGKARHAVSRPDERTVVLSLSAAELPKKLERSLDTTAFQGPVMMVSSFNQPSTGEVKIVATLRGDATDRDRGDEDRPLLDVPGGEGRAPRRRRRRPSSGSPTPSRPDSRRRRPAYALSGAPQARGYTGRRITLDFHDIEIRNLLRLIADVSKKNIVVADDVTGKVTVSLRNVPWDQALDLVLKSKGLGKEEMGNVIRIAKYEQIAKEQQARADAEKARAPLAAAQGPDHPGELRARRRHGRPHQGRPHRARLRLDRRADERPHREGRAGGARARRGARAEPRHRDPAGPHREPHRRGLVQLQQGARRAVGRQRRLHARRPATRPGSSSRTTRRRRAASPAAPRPARRPPRTTR